MDTLVLVNQQKLKFISSVQRLDAIKWTWNEQKLTQMDDDRVSQGYLYYQKALLLQMI